jgi:hypothetical protein
VEAMRGMGLICPLEMYSAWMSRDETGAMGLICPSETAFSMSVFRPRGAWASFVLRKHILSVSLEAARGMGLISPLERAFSLSVWRPRGA